MIFKSLLPFLCLSVLCLCFFGCSEEVDDPLDPDSEDRGQPEEVIDESSGSDVPVVSLIVDKTDDHLGTFFSYCFEIEKPLNHHLVIYFFSQTNERKDFFGFPGPVRTSKNLVVMKKGGTKTGFFRGSFTKGGRDIKELIKILPGEERRNVDLPIDVGFGFRPGSNVEGPVTIPAGYRFNPYRVGDPSEAVIVLKE